MKTQTIGYLFGIIASLAHVSKAGADGHKNIMGNELELCSEEPMTGYWRDGYCKTNEHDQGSHTVCAEITDEFLEYTKSMGNDLSTPRGGFPGLKPGDKWCLCASRWLQA